MRVVIVGAGPSGLVQLKVLLESSARFGCMPLEVKLLESHSEIGGVFSHHVYEDAELVSSKYLTAFSDFRPRPDDADFFSSERYLEYLREYADYFNLWPHIDLNTRVENITRGANGGHVVSYTKPLGKLEKWECDAVAICSGVHARPHVPRLPGIENVPTVMHSSEFKTREQFGKDKTVLVLGSGETGADLCYLGITSPTKQVILCHRSGWLGAPKRVPGQRFLPWLFGSKDYEYPQLPLDVSQITLFDTMYVHPIVRDSMQIWNYYHFVALPAGSWLCSGTPYGLDQWVGQVQGERFHASRLFFNKAWQRISKYVSHQYRPTTWPLATRIRRFFFHTAIPSPPRTIEVAPFPSHIDSSGIAHFPQIPDRPESQRISTMTIKPDILIYATGYVPSFPFLNTPSNAGQKSYPTNFDANVRQIWSDEDPTVGFIGFVRPGFGAIPPLAELQSMLFTMNLLGRVAPNSLSQDDEWHYRLIHPPDARVTYGVEHDSYAYQLAKDMGIAPSFTQVLRLSLSTRRGWRLPYIWAAGTAFNSKFRMVGDWKWDGAAEVMTGELWETISRRSGLFGNLSLSIIPMMYLAGLNATSLLYSSFWGALARIGLCKPLKRRIRPKEIMEQMEMMGKQKRHPQHQKKDSGMELDDDKGALTT